MEDTRVYRIRRSRLLLGGVVPVVLVIAAAMVWLLPTWRPIWFVASMSVLLCLLAGVAGWVVLWRVPIELRLDERGLEVLTLLRSIRKQWHEVDTQATAQKAKRSIGITVLVFRNEHHSVAITDSSFSGPSEAPSVLLQRKLGSPERADV